MRGQRLGCFYVAPFDVILDPADLSVVEPDLLYVGKDHLSRVHQQYLRGAPDLVVEVLSLSTALRDRNAKMQLYARYQVPSRWLFDPGPRTASAFILSESGYQLVRSARADEAFSAPPFPDLVIPLSQVWDQPPGD